MIDNRDHREVKQTREVKQNISDMHSGIIDHRDHLRAVKKGYARSDTSFTIDNSELQWFYN